MPLERSVGAGMTAYVRLRLRPRVFGLEHLRVEPRTIVAPNHRSDNDVPVLVAALFPHWALAVARGVPWPTFATDDDALLSGFLAGYPRNLPLWVRQLLWPIRVGGVLERRLRCIPVREPTRMLLVELLRANPQLALDGQLPPELKAALARRAEYCRQPPPERAEDVLRGIYADLLWTPVDRDQVARHDAVWRDHLRAAVSDFGHLVSALESGGMVVIYPEGELSLDGRIAPLKPGLASLAKRGQARWVQPVATCYDPLAAGRPRVYVSVAAPIVPESGRLTREVATALRRATPLTAGQIAARQLRRGSESMRELEAAATDLIDRARAEERPIEPSLVGPERSAFLGTVHRRAMRRGPHDPVIRRLAAEFEDAQSP